MAMAIFSDLRAPGTLLMATMMLLIIQAHGITRHYNFNVSICTFCTHFWLVILISHTYGACSIVVFPAGANGERDEAVRYQEHRDGEVVDVALGPSASGTA